ncbi:MAG: formylmethanofuran dehydrogenase subunit C, partial [Isosphaeraceae bacterium]
FGSVDVAAGAEMRGGLLHIKGNAGQGVGAAEAGSRLGMRGGLIVVEGDAGDDVGLTMRRGLIAILGRAGDGLGRGMIAGSIFVFGPVGLRPGAGMKRGTIALFTPEPPTLLPTFQASGRLRPPVLNLVLRHLRARNVPVPVPAFQGTITRYNGDLAARGQGEILSWAL